MWTFYVVHLLEIEGSLGLTKEIKYKGYQLDILPYEGVCPDNCLLKWPNINAFCGG
jgi:hypothetical protein